MCICLENSYARDAPINLRALPAQRDLIDQAATLLGKNRSDFMLEAACERAQSVLLDRCFSNWIRTSSSSSWPSWMRSANPGLARLMSVKAPWSTGAE